MFSCNKQVDKRILEKRTKGIRRWGILPIGDFCASNKETRIGKPFFACCCRAAQDNTHGKEKRAEARRGIIRKDMDMVKY